MQVMREPVVADQPGPAVRGDDERVDQIGLLAGRGPEYRPEPAAPPAQFRGGGGSHGGAVNLVRLQQAGELLLILRPGC